MRTKRWVVSGAIAWVASAGFAMAGPVRLDADRLPVIGKVDARFQSYNVEMAEIIGAKFWKPYAHMDKAQTGKAPVIVGGDPSLYEARPPVDLSNPRLVALAAALGPAYVRVSGTWA